MVRALQSDQVPNLLVMQYTPEWRVRNLMLVPSFFFSMNSVEKRKPLSPIARRAGWVGCNILLAAIADVGKIRIISDGVHAGANPVRESYIRVRPLARIEPTSRGWTLEVLRLIRSLNRGTFSLHDVYRFEPELASLYPANRNVRPKLRQQLQVLRNLGLLTFRGHGQYALTL
jgi:type II restriction enzyme